MLFGQWLIDEVVLNVYLVLLGRGKRSLSESPDAREIALVNTKTTLTGVLLNTYRCRGAVSPPTFADVSG